MYVGVDFLVDRQNRLFLSEVNIGLPGGAQEYDFVYRQKHKKASGIFEKIECLSNGLYGRSFKKYLLSLPYIDDLKILKEWMDEACGLPKRFHPQFRLEDKWVQYQILSKKYPMIETKVFTKSEIESIKEMLYSGSKVVLKKRFGRGGRGFIILEKSKDLDSLVDISSEYIYQPYIDSSIETCYGPLRLSLRAAAFSGNFLCMFANLSSKITSNHGIRTFVCGGKRLRLNNSRFNKIDITQKAWEAEILFGDKVPDHLYKNLYLEVISDTELVLPVKLIDTIKSYSEDISKYYDEIDLEGLPKCYLEQHYDF